MGSAAVAAQARLLPGGHWALNIAGQGVIATVAGMLVYGGIELVATGGGALAAHTAARSGAPLDLEAVQRVACYAGAARLLVLVPGGELPSLVLSAVLVGLGLRWHVGCGATRAVLGGLGFGVGFGACLAALLAGTVPLLPILKVAFVGVGL